MAILMAHNYYQRPGGEDQVFTAEIALLERFGHRVVRYTVHNDQVVDFTPLALVLATLWNRGVYRDLRRVIRLTRSSVVHVHNSFPLLSPSVYFAANDEGAPVIQTLHNYRLLCPNAIFFRDGHVCEDCLGRLVPWPGLVHRCYRQSRAATGTVAAMLVVHRLLRTWSRMVDVYVALTEFARRKLIAGGLPADRIVVKPNFVFPDPGPGDGAGGYGLFVGRLSAEKGVATLLAAWERLGGKIPLKVVGDGPEAPRVRAAIQRLPSVEWLGQRPAADVSALMAGAALVVVPSEWYEAFPRVVVEAFASGTPVAASDLGSLAELVEDGRTGLLFRPGDPGDLAARVEWLWAHRDRAAAMRREARAEYEAKYTADRNYERLMAIYRRAIAR